MKTIYSSVGILGLLLLVCHTTEATEDIPLKWKMQRWESVFTIQAGDTVTNSYNTNVETKIERTLRGKKEDFPKSDQWPTNYMTRGRYYLIHYYKAPEGYSGSGWGRNDLERAGDSFVVKAIQAGQDKVFYGTTAFYKDMPLKDFEMLLKKVPFEANPTNTFMYKEGHNKNRREYQEGAANGSQPIRAETNRTSTAADAPYSYPHDFKQPTLPKVYLVDDSRGNGVTITADGTTIWRGAVAKSDEMPNIHTVGVPPNSQRECRIRITGGPYSAERSVDWQKGKALVVHFLDDRVAIDQKQEPVGFQ